MALKHFAQYIFLKDVGQLPKRGQTLLEARPEIHNVLRSRRLQERPVPVTVTHLPDMEGRLQDFPPNLDSTSDRRRTIADANNVHDATGDAEMGQSGQDGWVFPQVGSSPS